MEAGGVLDALALAIRSRASSASKAELMAQVDGLAVRRGEVSRVACCMGLRRFSEYFVASAWVANIGLLIAAFGWIYLFGQSRGIVELMKYQIGSVDPAAGIIIRDPSRLSSGVTIGIIAAAGAMISAVVMLGSLFAGSRRFRTTRSWLVFMAVVCGWLGLAVSWPAIYWFGQQQRVKAALPGSDVMVQTLRSNWPTADTALPDIGPFLAYPVNAPTAVLPLSDATFPKTGLRFSAVERTGDDVLRFELTGAELGAWLEWRGDGSEPRAFAGGLDTEYVVVQAARLSAEWFLVRYRAAGLVERGVRLSPQVR